MNDFDFPAGVKKMGCCDDPTVATKVDPRELLREQKHYGDLVRDLFTDPPEKVLLRLLSESNVYLRELAALRAYYPAVRLRAIELLELGSMTVLQQIISQESESPYAAAARQRIEQLNRPKQGLLSSLFKSD